MAVADVDDLIRTISLAVADDLGARRTRDGLPPVTLHDRQVLEALLADGLVAEDRQEAWRVLTDLVANSAYRLGSEDSTNPTERQARFAVEICGTYADGAGQSLLRQSLPEATMNALGPPPEPSARGEAAVVRGILRNLSQRTGQVDPDHAMSEDALVNHLASFGLRAGQEAARVVVRRRSAFLGQRGELNQLTLSDEERIAARAAEELEGGVGDVRTTNPDQGVAVDRAVAVTDRILHQLAPEVVLPISALRDLSAGAQDRPQSVHELVERVQVAVGDLTEAKRTLWNTRTAEMRANPGDQVGVDKDGALLLTAEAEQSLAMLTVAAPDGPLTPEQMDSARETLQEVATELTQLAVPEGHTRADERNTDAVSPRFDPIGLASSRAFAEDELNTIIDAALPADQAAQLRAPEPAFTDPRLAPAARGLATAIDAAAGQQATPGQALRRMAGQGREGVASAAAEELALNRGLSEDQVPDAVSAIAGQIDDSFTNLPGEASKWRSIEHQQFIGGQTASASDHSRSYGEGLCERVSEVLERHWPSESVARFAGHDPAMTTPTSIEVPAETPVAGRAGTTVQQSDRGNQL